MMSEFFLHMLQSQNKQGFSRTYCVQIFVLSVHELHEPHKSQLLLWSRAAGAIQTWQIAQAQDQCSGAMLPLLGQPRRSAVGLIIN